ncbi:hypothetical protein RIF29_03739 [Crotalaria pallida]|uniref:Reverse transcriptase zinc-binding domain-containing protein n=1 Tax=Crotalaria pallida TaxID=3830 RepID=A0AAN9J096_CROPI
MCGHCNLEPEFVLHCLLDCHKVHAVWDSFGADNFAWFWLENNIVKWIQKGINDIGTRFITIIWWIWRARCDECISLQVITTQMVMHRASMMASDIDKCYGVSAVSVKQVRWVSWVFPISNVTVLNVDGSSLGNPCWSVP